MASIKTHICQLTWSSCGHDLNTYVTQSKDLLQLLGSAPTTEFLPNLFWQFKSIPCYYFNKAIMDLEQHYYLGNEPGLTCLSLCAKVVKIQCIQEQAQQWDAPAPNDQHLQALHFTLASHHQILATLMAQSQDTCQKITTMQPKTTFQECSLMDQRSSKRSKHHSAIQQQNMVFLCKMPRWYMEYNTHHGKTCQQFLLQ